MVVSRSCSGLISPRPLKRVTLRLGARILGRDAIEDARAFGIVERVVDVLAHIDAIQRRHRDVDVPRTTSGRKCRRNSAHSSVAMCARRSRRRRGCKPCDSAGREVLSEPGSTPSAIVMSCTSCDCSTSAASTSQVLRILPRSGITAWNSRSRACFAEPPAESPSTRNSSPRAGCCGCSQRACRAVPARW